MKFWYNLPVKDIATARAFYTAIGFAENPMHAENDQVASFYVGDDKVVMMLFPEEQFSGFVQHSVADTDSGSEVLLNIDASSQEAVDQMANKVKEAGGSIYTPPTQVLPWMYGCGFADPDGHRWNIVYFDMSKRH